MATRYLTSSLLAKRAFFSAVSRYSTTAVSVTKASSILRRFRPLVVASSHLLRVTPVRTFATRQTSSSLNDPNPNWTNRPPKETILLDGCDFEHWLVVMEKPEGDPTRDEIIDSYIKTLAMVVGSEEEARMKIYSVSTRHYFAFGALVSEELSYKLKELPRVRWVLPDSYLDVKNKDYGGEPFIDGQAVPYDPKYHEEWVRNNARANERNRRNDRPRNFDRSRNYERRRDNQMGNQNTGGNFGGGPPNNPGSNMGAQATYAAVPPNNPGPNTGGQPNYGGPPPSNPGPNMGGQPNYGGPPPSNPGQNVGPRSNYAGMPPNNNPGPNMGAQSNYAGVPPQTNPGQNIGAQSNYAGVPPNNPGNYGPPNRAPNYQYGNGPNSGGMPPYQSGPSPNQPGFAPNAGPGQGHQQSGYGPNPGANYSSYSQNAPNNAHGPGPTSNAGPNGGYGSGQRQSNQAPNMGPGPNPNGYGPNNGYAPNSAGENTYRNENVPGRD